jgi:hypothetical protein
MAWTVHSEKSVACPFVCVKLVSLAMALQFALYVSYLSWIWVCIVSTKKTQKWAGHICGHINGCHWSRWCQLVGWLHHTSAVANNSGVYAIEIAGHKVDLASAGAVAYNAYFPI